MSEYYRSRHYLSDHYQCKRYWTKSGVKCYKVQLKSNEWNNARDLCKHEESDLATVKTKSDLMAMGTILDEMLARFPSKKITAFYIGMRNVGTWKWLNGDVVLPSMWRYNPLDDFWNVECAVIRRTKDGFRLAKQVCTNKIFFVCDSLESKCN